jgi:hypothetical protein
VNFKHFTNILLKILKIFLCRQYLIDILKSDYQEIKIENSAFKELIFIDKLKIYKVIESFHQIIGCSDELIF